MKLVLQILGLLALLIAITIPTLKMKLSSR